MQEGKKLSDPSLLSLLIADSLGNHFSCVCFVCGRGEGLPLSFRSYLWSWKMKGARDWRMVSLRLD